MHINLAMHSALVYRLHAVIAACSIYSIDLGTNFYSYQLVIAISFSDLIQSDTYSS